MLSVLRNPIPLACCLLLSATHASAATPTVSGQSGYVNMPSASVDVDGAFSLGYSYDSPYATTWLSATVLPFLQVTGRYVAVRGIPGFSSVPGEYGSEYGSYKDKVIDAKLRLWEEGAWLPSLAVGRTDLFGTSLFEGHYVVATKTFGQARNFEASLGFGDKRPDGVFAGARWTPQTAPRWSVVAEYDANNYQADFRAAETAAGKRRNGVAVGLEYRWGWLGAQVARHRDHFSANVFASIPLAEREFIPKFMEPPPYQPKVAPSRASFAQWRDEPVHAEKLVTALAGQDFKNIRIMLDGGVLRLSLTNARISEMGRAVGRASRTALAFAPLGTRAIHVTYTRVEQPLATYEMRSIDALSDYLAGVISRERFMQTVLVRYADQSDQFHDDGTLLSGLDESATMAVHRGRDGEAIQISSEDREDNRFKLSPKVNFFFNDPSGALRYEVAAAANYDKRLGSGFYFNSALRLGILENITGVTQASNSLLPHVRSDIAEYKRGSRFKLNRMLLSKYFTPADQVYARLSGGLYEEMFRGFGGQVLYLPNDSRWAADVSIDALQQRGVKGWFDSRDYRTVTGFGSLHYKLPLGMNLTARAGRFLAKDEGVRVEFKRIFRSGIELGAWYSKTNGKDITNPGTPGNPYNDKGVFLSIPLRSMLPTDSQAIANFGISPWTRDVGQMVLSPGDLYGIMEQPRRDLHMFDGMGDFGERADERNLPAVLKPDAPLENPWPRFRLRLEHTGESSPPLSHWVRGAGLAGGAVLASALLDKPVDRYVKRHENSRANNTWGNFGKNMPLALIATSGVAVAMGDERMQNMGIVSLQSVAAAVGVTMVGKQVIGRARPEEERGSWARAESRSDSALPSGHSAAAFAAVTPFAQEYDAPWLYGVAAVSSMGRVASRKHWVSDTVAGGLIGYTIGTLLWQGQRDMVSDKRSRLSIVPGNKELTVAWQKTY